MRVKMTGTDSETVLKWKSISKFSFTFRFIESNWIALKRLTTIEFDHDENENENENQHSQRCHVMWIWWVFRLNKEINGPIENDLMQY